MNTAKIIKSILLVIGFSLVIISNTLLKGTKFISVIGLLILVSVLLYTGYEAFLNIKKSKKAE